MSAAKVSQVRQAGEASATGTSSTAPSFCVKKRKKLNSSGLAGCCSASPRGTLGASDLSFSNHVLQWVAACVTAVLGARDPPQLELVCDSYFLYPPTPTRGAQPAVLLSAPVGAGRVLGHAQGGDCHVLRFRKGVVAQPHELLPPVHKTYFPQAMLQFSNFRY